MDLRRVLDGLGDDEFDDEAVARSRARLLEGIPGDAGFASPRGDAPARTPRRSLPVAARAWMPIAASVALVATIVGGVTIAMMQGRRDAPIAATPSTRPGVVIDLDETYQCGPVWTKGAVLTGPHQSRDGLEGDNAANLDYALSELGTPTQWVATEMLGHSLAVLAPAPRSEPFGAEFSYARITEDVASGRVTGTLETGTCSLQRNSGERSSQPFEVVDAVHASSRTLRLMVRTYRCSASPDDYSAKVVESSNAVEVTVHQVRDHNIGHACLPSIPHKIEVTARLTEPIGDRVLIRPGQVPADQVFGAPPG